MEMSEDSIDTVRIDQGVGKKTVSDSLKIGIADDGDYLQRQLLAIHEELRKRLNNIHTLVLKQSLLRLLKLKNLILIEMPGLKMLKPIYIIKTC